LPAISSDTVRRFLPFALRLAKTFLPLGVDILSLNPCLLRLFLFEGWYVRFIGMLFNGAVETGVQK